MLRQLKESNKNLGYIQNSDLVYFKPEKKCELSRDMHGRRASVALLYCILFIYFVWFRAKRETIEWKEVSALEQLRGLQVLKTAL